MNINNINVILITAIALYGCHGGGSDLTEVVTEAETVTSSDEGSSQDVPSNVVVQEKPPVDGNPPSEEADDETSQVDSNSSSSHDIEVENVIMGTATGFDYNQEEIISGAGGARFNLATQKPIYGAINLKFFADGGAIRLSMEHFDDALQKFGEWMHSDSTDYHSYFKKGNAHFNVRLDLVNEAEQNENFFPSQNPHFYDQVQKFKFVARVYMEGTEPGDGVIIGEHLFTVQGDMMPPTNHTTDTFIVTNDTLGGSMLTTSDIARVTITASAQTGRNMCIAVSFLDKEKKRYVWQENIDASNDVAHWYTGETGGEYIIDLKSGTSCADPKPQWLGRQNITVHKQ